MNFISLDVQVYKIFPYLDEVSLIRLTVLSRYHHNNIWEILKGRSSNTLVDRDGRFFEKEVHRISDSSTMKLLRFEVMSTASFISFIKKTDNSLYLLERRNSETFKYVCENSDVGNLRLTTLGGPMKSIVEPLSYILRNMSCSFLKLRVLSSPWINRKEQKKKFYFVFKFLRILDKSRTPLDFVPIRGFVPEKKITKRSLSLYLLCIRLYLETLDDPEDIERHLKEGLFHLFNVYPMHSLILYLSMFRKRFRCRPEMYRIGINQILDYCKKRSEEGEEFIMGVLQSKIVPQRWDDACEILQYAYSKSKHAKKTFWEEEFFRIACHFGSIDIVKFLISEKVPYEEILKNEKENTLDKMGHYWTTCHRDKWRKQTVQLVVYLFDLLSSSKKKKKKKEEEEEEGEENEEKKEEERETPFFDLISSFEKEKDGCKKCFYDACMASGIKNRLRSFIRRKSRIREATEKIEEFGEKCISDILHKVKEKGDHDLFCNYFLKSQFYLSKTRNEGRVVIGLRTNRILLNLVYKYFDLKHLGNFDIDFKKVAYRMLLLEYVGSSLVRFLGEKEEDVQSLISFMKMMLNNERNLLSSVIISTLKELEECRTGHKTALKRLLERDDVRKILCGSIKERNSRRLIFCNALSEHVADLCHLSKIVVTQKHFTSIETDRNFRYNRDRHIVMTLFSVLLKDPDFVVKKNLFKKLIEIARKVEPKLENVLHDLRDCKKV